VRAEGCQNLTSAPNPSFDTLHGQGSGSDADERARLWAEVTSIAPGYLKYQQRTQREIPLMILEPMGGA
jgi:hypothetical protein